LTRDYGAAAAIAGSIGGDSWGDQANIALPRSLYLAWAQRAVGNAAAARAAAAAALDTNRAALAAQPDDALLHLALGLAEAEQGDKNASREGRQAAALLSVQRDAYTGPGVLVWLAALEVRVGENDAAFDHLRLALGLSSGAMVSPAALKLDPFWDPIRNDPRFAQLLALGEQPVETTAVP
jgi:serine/threonine-protein kinase